MAEGPPALMLPPNFVAHRLSEAEMAAGGPSTRAGAGAEAEALGAGALVWGRDARHLSLAVVFEPETPLVEARLAFYAGMAALAQAVAAAAAPERAVTIGWPDTIRYDGARLGGGTLLAPECAEAEVPAWLVFGADVIAARPELPAPGALPDSTSLAEEEIGPVELIVESFARNLLRNVDSWTALGFAAFAPAYLDRLAGEADVTHALAPDGTLVTRSAANVIVRRALVPALAARGWFDPVRGGPRL